MISSLHLRQDFSTSNFTSCWQLKTSRHAQPSSILHLSSTSST